MVGKPVVENGDKRLPLRVALVHRRPGAASLLHRRHRWSPPATSAPPTPTARSLLLRERAGVSSLDACGLPGRRPSPCVASKVDPRAKRGAEDPMFGTERGADWAGPNTVRPDGYEDKRIFVGYCKLGWTMDILIV